MSRPKRAIQRAAGFTLVELLLALTLMSMLLALAYGGLRASTRATEKGQQVLEDSSRIRMAHQFVRRQMNQLLPLAWEVREEEGERAIFSGNARRIRFVAPMPGYLGFGGPQVQELEFVPGEEGYDLVLSHALLQNFEEEYLYEREPIFLLGNIRNASFSFLGVDENGELTDWMSSWEDVSMLPVSVSLQIEFNEDVYIQWPLLAASVRSDPTGMRGADVEESPYTTTIRKMLQRSGKKE
jgi:general secretion pathway protein J